MVLLASLCQTGESTPLKVSVRMLSDTATGNPDWSSCSSVSISSSCIGDVRTLTKEAWKAPNMTNPKRMQAAAKILWDTGSMEKV